MSLPHWSDTAEDNAHNMAGPPMSKSSTEREDIETSATDRPDSAHLRGHQHDEEGSSEAIYTDKAAHPDINDDPTMNAVRDGSAGSGQEPNRPSDERADRSGPPGKVDLASQIEDQLYELLGADDEYEPPEEYQREIKDEVMRTLRKILFLWQSAWRSAQGLLTKQALIIAVNIGMRGPRGNLQDRELVHFNYARLKCADIIPKALRGLQWPTKHRDRTLVEVCSSEEATRDRAAIEYGMLMVFNDLKHQLGTDAENTSRTSREPAGLPDFWAWQVAGPCTAKPARARPQLNAIVGPWVAEESLFNWAMFCRADGTSNTENRLGIGCEKRADAFNEWRAQNGCKGERTWTGMEEHQKMLRMAFTLYDTVQASVNGDDPTTAARIISEGDQAVRQAKIDVAAEKQARKRKRVQSDEAGEGSSARPTKSSRLEEDPGVLGDMEDLEEGNADPHDETATDEAVEETATTADEEPVQQEQASAYAGKGKQRAVDR
ncbi:hypothetical protein LTR53_002087 [Teratosphaeriaceae sp. CCFEE 6253]|nr:hypothetical protein LTR53_002087 [Teratosphaeriaceae sp. CCFEE 6253]